MFKMLQVKMKVFVKDVEECMKMKKRQQWLHVLVLQKAVAGSRCQMVDVTPSHQDQLADEMLASLYHTAPIRLR